MGRPWAIFPLLSIIAAVPLRAEEWPTYRHDSARSNVTEEGPRLPLEVSWVFVPRHRPFPAWFERFGGWNQYWQYDLAHYVSVAGGKVFFGTSADHKVYCLDAETGRVLWRRFVNGPVRFAPTVWGDRVFVCSDDGYVYCLRAEDGELIWKFRGGPSERKAVNNGKIISVWPIRTGVAVRDGIVYFAAGLFPAEGVFVYALRAEDGEVVWCNDSCDQMFLEVPHAESLTGIAPEGPILVSERRVYVLNGRNVPAIFDRKTGRLISWRPVIGHVGTAGGYFGGAWALLTPEALYGGKRSGLVAYNLDKCDVTASFPGDELVVKGNMAYLLKGGEITALDRTKFLSLKARRKRLARERLHLRHFMYFSSGTKWVDDWWVIGPFDLGATKFTEEPPPGFDRPYPPEREIDLSKVYVGKGGRKVKWVRAKSEHYGYLTIDKYLKDLDFSIVYALTYIYSPEDREVSISLTGNGLKVWINDELVLSHHVLRGGGGWGAYGQDIAFAKLRRGWNKVLVKVEHYTGGCGISFGILECNGLKYSAVKDPNAKTLSGGRPELREKMVELKRMNEEIEGIDKELPKCVKWRANFDCRRSLILADDVLFNGGDGRVVAVDSSTGRKLWEGKVEGKALGLAFAEGRLFVSCDNGRIYCFSPEGGRAEVREPTNPSPFPEDEFSALYRRAAERIVKRTGIRRGLCLVLGLEDGRLAFELARRTDLTIYAVTPDEGRAERLRRVFDSAGLYGTRVVIDCYDPSSLPYPPYIANLVVSESIMASGRLWCSAREVFRLLRPCGGTAYLGWPEGMGGGLDLTRLRRWMERGLSEAGVSNVKVEVETDGGVWVRAVQGSLPGAGEWTHQYADPANTGCSGDEIVKAPFGLLWFGRPGPLKMIDRHARAPAPVVANGRFFVSGNNWLMAYDLYNGTPLWERRIEGFRRRFMHTNVTNLVAAPESVYAVVGRECLRIDAETGRTLARWEAPDGEDGLPRTWGFVAVKGDLLIGSGSPIFTFPLMGWGDYYNLSRTVPFGVLDKLKVLEHEPLRSREELSRRTRELVPEEEARRYEGKLVEFLTKTKEVRRLSDVVFALDRRTGRLIWRRQFEGGFVYHPAIAVGDERIYLLVSRKAGSGTRRLVALDLRTGRKVLDKPLDVSGIDYPNLSLSYYKGKLVVALTESGGRLIVASARTGEVLWDKRVSYKRRPVIVGDTLYAEPHAYDLETGEERTMVHPITGERVKWGFFRSYGCGTISASLRCLFFRSGAVGFYDLTRDMGVSNWGGIRPGCWLNIVPVGGCVLIPEASSGCACGYPFQTTVALIPMGRSEYWAIFPKLGESKPVRHLAVNLGAPGDRRDGEGILWIGYPQTLKKIMGHPRIDPPIRVEVTEGLGYYRFNSERVRVEGTDRPWLFSSGCCGIRRFVVDLGASGRYTVRLGFAEPMDVKEGERVFDVRIQRRTALKNFDIVREAGGILRAVVREFRDVECNGTLTIEFVPKRERPTMREAPLVCWVEVEK